MPDVGIYGISDSASAITGSAKALGKAGIIGKSDTYWSIVGSSSATYIYAAGVYASGSTSPVIMASSMSNYAVKGLAQSGGYGIYGSDVLAIVGISDSGNAIYGSSIYGVSNSGHGIISSAINSGNAIIGISSNSDYGVIAESKNTSYACLRLVPLANAPSSGGSLGDLYVNSTDNKIYFYNGTAWVSL